MTTSSDPDAAAMQYLVWALEFIEKSGDLKHHARLAVEALRERIDLAASK